MECFLTSLMFGFLIYRVGVTMPVFQREGCLIAQCIRVADVRRQEQEFPLYNPC